MPPRKRKAQESPKEVATPEGSSTSPFRQRSSPKQRTGIIAKERDETDWAFLVRAGPQGGREAADGSVARRGMPPGSIARAADGFEVRSIDGVLPLLSHQSVAKAMQKIATGESQAAAGILRHAHVPSVNALCREWHLAWGLAVPASLAGGEPLPAESAARVAASCAPNAKRSALPGRMLVVSVGEGDQSQSAPWESLVDCEFESGEALARACNAVKLATYELTVSADQPWVSARVMQQRLRGLETNGEALPLFSCILVYPHEGARLHVHFSRHEGGAELTDTEEADGIQRSAGDGRLWALLEGAHSKAGERHGATSLLLCASSTLVQSSADCQPGTDRRTLQAAGTTQVDHHPRAAKSASSLPAVSSHLMMPPPEKSRRVAQAASLLQKAIRRSSALSSPLPLLEGCRSLLGYPEEYHGGDGHASIGDSPGNSSSGELDNPRELVRGGAFALFWTIATCAFSDAAPCATSGDGASLGCAELVALALACRVDPSWTPPTVLIKRAVRGPDVVPPPSPCVCEARG